MLMKNVKKNEAEEREREYERWAVKRKETDFFGRCLLSLRERPDRSSGGNWYLPSAAAVPWLSEYYREKEKAPNREMLQHEAL